MKRMNSARVAIAAAVIAVLLFAMILFVQSGVMDKTPAVEAVPDNCYEETLYVITDEDYSPYSFYTPDGRASGHDVELIILIANEMGMNLDLRLMNWYDAIDAMGAGEADVLMTCDYSDTFAGVDTLKKCEPVSSDDFIVYSKKRISSPDEIYGTRIAIMKNGNVNAQIDMMNLRGCCVEYRNNREAMQALIDGEVDCAVMRQTVGTVLLKELDAKGIEGYIGIGQSFMCFGVSGNDPELTARINSAIETLKMNGELSRLHDKWLTTFIRPYTLREVMENNPWLESLLILLIAVTVFTLYMSSARKKKSDRAQHQRDMEQQEKLQSAYDRLNEANRRNDIIHDIIHSGKWSFFVNAADEIVRGDVSAEANDIIRNEVPADGHSWLDIVHPDDRGYASEAFGAAIRDHSCNTPYDVNYRMIDRDGAYRWFHSAGRMVRNEDGSGEFFGIHVDITDQMEEQQKRLLGAVPLSSDILTKANIGMWAFELDEGQPPRMYVDDTMLGLIGLKEQVPPEETYHAWYDHIDPGSYDLVSDAVSKMSSGEHAEVQYPWHHPDGHTMVVRCGGVRNFVYTKGVRIEGTHQDVTQTLHFDEEERKRAEQQRRDEIARVKAEASDKAKTEFLFNMSHDIRTPMNAILGYTDIAIRHSSDPEKVNESLMKIRTAGGHLLSLINDILEMSRIEAGKLEIGNVPLDIRAAIRGVDQMSRALAVPKSIDFSTVVGEMKNPYIYADELHINQVLINLISNAVKYTGHGGKVEYRAEQISDPAKGIARYRFTVKDTGIGMSEEFQLHLFENFSRENDAAVSQQEGAGLGLAIVKRITDMAGGTIEVRSKKGEGSTFIVELPFRVMDGPAIERFNARHTENVVHEDAGLKGKRILLVDDNEMNREIASELLEEVGFVIDTAEDGEIAVEAVTGHGIGYYSFILMDIQMPVMDGYEATRAIRALPGGDRIPIIALSANAFEEDRRRSLAEGMDAHIAKPIDVKVLLAEIRRLADRK